MTKNLIILAGGASSRMKKSSSSDLSNAAQKEVNTRSKGLILLNGRPMLDYLLYNAKQAGLKHIYIVISPDGDLFKSYYGKETSGNLFKGLTISYATQHIPTKRIKPLGTADAVTQALEQYPELQAQEFIVCNCDNLYSVNAFKALLKTTEAHAFINYNRATLQFSKERIARFALTKVSARQYLEDIIEKPSPEETEQYRDDDGNLSVSMNIFKFSGTQFYSYLKMCPIHKERQEKELPTALLMMVRDKPESMRAIPMSEHVPDLTSKEDISIMNDYLSTHFAGFDWR